MKKLFYLPVIFCLLNLCAFADNLQSIDSIVGNYNNRVNVVFSDIDGTMFPKGCKRGEAPQSAKQAVIKLKRANIPVILVTGRSYEDVKAINRSLGLKNSYIVTLQGAEIINPKGKIIYQSRISNNDTVTILKQLDNFIKANNFNSKIYIYLGSKLYSTEYFEIPYTWDKLIVLKSYDQLGKFTPSKIGVYDSNTKNLEIIKMFLQQKFPKYLSYLSTTCFCELTKPDATKGNGVRRITNILKTDLKNAAAFGDAENDSSMLNTVKKSGGLAVAVENAMDGLKQNANYETKSVDAGGVDYAVDKILENNKLLDKTVK